MPPESSEFQRIHLKNVRCFRDAEIPLDKRVTVIVGGNASGKTTIMEALASLTYGSEEGLAGFPLRHGSKHGQIALYQQGRRPAAAKWDSSASDRQRLPSDRLVFLYGRYRRVLLPEETENRNLTDTQYLDELSSHAAQMRTTTLTRPDNRLLQNLPGYLRGIYSGRASDPRLETLWQRLNDELPKIDPSLGGIRMDPGSTHLIPHIIRNGIPLGIEELSDGYQTVLVIVLDLMLRYPYLFFEGDPLDGHALVGVDEIDLHLHPRLQRTVLGNLTSLFKNTQFILTTHSPMLVQAAIDLKFTILRLVEDDGAVVAKPLSDKHRNALRGAEVGSLLFEEHLFDVESRFSVETQEIEKRADELKDLVASGEATPKQHDEMKRTLNKLEELVAKEDRRRSSGSTMAQMVQMQAEFVKALTDELKKARHEET